MITFMHPLQSPFRYKALSTDEKPTDATYGSMLLEEDTGVWHIFYGGVWSVASTSSFDPSSGTLTVYHDVKAGDQPWDGDASEVREVIIADTVRSIGAGAFASLESLEYVSIPAGVEVEDGAFSQTFKDPFDADIAMADVAGYEYVACEGVMYQADPSIFTYNSAGAFITGLVDATGVINVVIPRANGSTAITEVAQAAFDANTVIKRVFSLPDHAVTIRNNAVRNCTALTDAYFGNKTVYQAIFWGSAVRHTNVPSAMTLFNNNTFWDCSSLQSINIPSNIETIGQAAFRNCTSLTEVTLNEGLKTINAQAFYGDAAIQAFSLPASVETILTTAFRDCRGVSSVSFAPGFSATLEDAWCPWTFYAANGTTVIDKSVAANLAGKTFKGKYDMLVEDAGPQPGMEGRYMYAITTDSAGMNILSVQAAHDGRPLDTVVTASTRRQGAENIPEEWDFVNGVGPFKCWYGAFNIQDYVAGTESEAPVCTGAGMLAYRLDPYDLGTTMQGTELQGTYNVFLVVPTVYWKAVGNILYLSDDASYAGITGMTAYAHTATLPDTTTSVFPYLGIGVYEAYSEDGVLLSVPGKSPTVNLTCDQFKALADALDPAEDSDYQQWNFFQWTLFKMMVYTVMGTKNSQWMMGNGPVSGSASSTTGLADSAGPYAASTSQYDKVFIENSWGSVWNFVGDTSVNEYQLYAGNTLGGADLGSGGNQAEMTGIVLPSTNGYPDTTYLDGSAWDMPKTIGTDHHADPAYAGDHYWQNTGWRCLIVGGRWNDGSQAGVSAVPVNDSLSSRYSSIGSRLAYLMAADAAAPSEGGRALLSQKSSPSSARAELAEMVRLAQEEALAMEPEPMPEAEPEAAPEEPTEEPVESVEEPEEPAEEPVAEEPDEPAVEEGTIDL